MDLDRYLSTLDIRPMGIHDANVIIRFVRQSCGLSYDIRDILTPPTGNMKLDKAKDVVTYGVALMPAESANIGVNTCRFSTQSCRDGCVAFTGQQSTRPNVALGRTWRTTLLAGNASAFEARLMHELLRAQSKHGGRLRVRLNTFSDLRWEVFMPALFETGISFYDYTKWPHRKTPDNYRLTLSATERWNVERIQDNVFAGQNVSVVFGDVKRTDDIEGMVWHGMDVIDGDKSDNRHDDRNNSVVALRAKGTSMKGSPMCFTFADGL